MIQSPIFWMVLAASVVGYWLLPRRIRDGFLAIVSFGYLASLEPVTVTVVVGWGLFFFYLAPHAIAARRAKRLVLPGLILAALSYLAYHKYVPQLAAMFSAMASAETPIVPLGISYFTFKLIHYAVEVARENITDRSLSRFFCYMFLYPIFTAGPIERFDHFLAEREESWQVRSMVEGVTRIAHGLIKLSLVNLLLQPRYFSVPLPTATDLLQNLSDLRTHEVWGFLFLAFMRAYLDFSAYSDIAIGASRLYGFRIMENFRFPILAPNIGEFWRRWHMTLVAWCRAYVYMPMIGLTRNPYVAVYCTFVAMGLWHGGSLNWLCWGLYHATGVSVFLTWGRIRRSRGWHFGTSGPFQYAGIPLTLIFVSGSYAFSSTAEHGLYPAVRVLAKMFGVDLAA
ncbi:MAG: MBOAT family O-acyltransferase [Planctomycetota bacterium]